MDEQTQKRAINIPTMDEQTDKGNQYSYDGRTDRQGKSIYLRWMNRQTRAINIPRMDEQTVKSNQYTYDGLTDRQGQSIYLTGAVNIPTMDG
jgi:hypothetical protein